MGLLRFLILFLSLSFDSYASEGWFYKIGQDLASPLTTDARYIVIGGAIATGTTYVTRINRTYSKRESYKEAKPLGDIGFIGDVIGYGLLNGGYIISQYLYGRWNQDDEAFKNAEVMFRATLSTMSWVVMGKTLINERRPGFPDDSSSFPSGHAAASFAFASVVTARHGWGYGTLAHAVAGFVAVSRVNDDFHYLHDIMAGITIGASYGWGIHYLTQKTAPESGKRNYWFSAVPLGKKGTALSFTYEF